jgi:hypothetical protein
MADGEYGLRASIILMRQKHQWFIAETSETSNIFQLTYRVDNVLR